MLQANSEKRLGPSRLLGPQKDPWKGRLHSSPSRSPTSSFFSHELGFYGETCSFLRRARCFSSVLRAWLGGCLVWSGEVLCFLLTLGRTSAHAVVTSILAPFTSRNFLTSSRKGGSGGECLPVTLELKVRGEVMA